MPQRDPVEDIRRPYERVKDVTVVLYIILWNRGHDGYLWVYPSVVINIAPGSGNINTTIQTPNGGFVTVALSRSGYLFDVDDGWLNSNVRLIFYVSLECVRDTYRPSCFSIWQQHLSQLFRAHYPIPSDTFPKKSGHLS